MLKYKRLTQALMSIHQTIGASLGSEAAMRGERRIVPKRSTRSIMNGGVIPVDFIFSHELERERERGGRGRERVRESKRETAVLVD
jgi:hypothetical protein